MSELISGKEALIAFANGEKVEYFDTRETFKELGWACVSGMQAWLFLDEATKHYKFRLKPRTITLNGIEVPAPFEPKDSCIVYILDDSKTDSYRAYNYEHDGDNINSFISMWESEEEIKQVVEALRSVFK
jgi:hypothetical protein